MFPSLNLFRKPNDVPEDPTNGMFQNLFPPPTSQDPFQGVNQSQPEQQTQPNGFMDVYKELMNRQNGPAMQAYRKFVEEEAPTRQSTKVNLATKLGAILSGAAAGWQGGVGEGTRVGTSIAEAPYLRATEEYNNRGGRLREAANLEENDTKNRISSVKAVGDMMDKKEDNDRQAKLADSTIATNAARAKASGNKVIHADDGHVYVFDSNNQKTDLGKLSETPEEKTSRAIKQAVGTAQGVSPIIESRTKRVNAASSANTEGREKRIGEIKFGQEKELEGIRQDNRLQLTDERAKKAAENAAARVKVTTPSALNQIRTNLRKVQSIVDATPDKYEGLWDRETGTLGAKPEEGTPEATAYAELYNALYNGVSTLPTTKAGNKIVR